MFKDIKNREILTEILLKLNEIDNKISILDKHIRDKQKSVKSGENQVK